MSPHIATLAKNHRNDLIVVKINTEKYQRTAGALGVTAIPTLVVYRDGKLAKQQPGALMGAQLEAFVAPYLG